MSKKEILELLQKVKGRIYEVRSGRSSNLSLEQRCTEVQQLLDLREAMNKQIGVEPRMRQQAA